MVTALLESWLMHAWLLCGGGKSSLASVEDILWPLPECLQSHSDCFVHLMMKQNNTVLLWGEGLVFQSAMS